MNVMFVVNNAYINQLLIVLNSLFINQKVGINVYLITDGLSDENYNIVQNFISKRHGKLFYKSYGNICIDVSKLVSHRWNPIVFYKLYGIFDISEVKKILYLDVDIIVDADLMELYGTDLDGCYAAVVHDNGLEQVFLDYDIHIKRLGVNLSQYFNAGMMLLNLEKIQHDMSLNYLIDQYNKYAELYVYNEQDLLNMFWNSKIKYVDYRYNRLATDFRYRKNIEKDRNVAIYHYTIDKPWDKFDSKTSTYQWCIKKYLQYAQIPEVSNFYSQIRKYNFNIYRNVISMIKCKLQYNPVMFISEKCGYRHFLKQLFFFAGECKK